MQNSNYSITEQTNKFEGLNQWLKQQQYSQIVVLVDTNTQKYCLPILQKALDSFVLNPIVIKAGEQYKNIETCKYIWSSMMDLGVDRKAILLNLGGGVIGDMGGFCASTFKRGIDFAQIPTTLLAQVDASVGGKLGVDFNLVKNSIGLFCNPKAVFLNAFFFNTLASEEIKSGYAEIIKHSLIYDANQWQSLSLNIDLKNINWVAIIKKSLNIKQIIVQQDPFEKGIRKSLNFGHTIGHVIESWSWQTPQPLLHGYAVALGIITECYLSWKLLDFPKEKLIEISQYIFKIYPKYNLDSIDKSTISKLLLQDKKNERNQINCTLLTAIGQSKINIPITLPQVEEALDYYSSF